MKKIILLITVFLSVSRGNAARESHGFGPSPLSPGFVCDSLSSHYELHVQLKIQNKKITTGLVKINDIIIDQLICTDHFSTMQISTQLQPTVFCRSQNKNHVRWTLLESTTDVILKINHKYTQKNSTIFICR